MLLFKKSSEACHGSFSVMGKPPYSMWKEYEEVASSMMAGWLEGW